MKRKPTKGKPALKPKAKKNERPDFSLVALDVVRRSAIAVYFMHYHPTSRQRAEA
jgi:hypothetical protein